MKRLAWIGGGVVALALLVAGGLWLRDFVVLHIVGWTAPKVEPNRPVVWQPGPDQSPTPANQRPPNIVLIVADDLGAGDVGYAGGTRVATPHIDALAREGAILAAGYAGNGTCAPSRAALMTGRYPTRFGFEFTPAPVQFARTIARMEGRGADVRPIFFEDRAKAMPPVDDLGVPTDEITVAEALKARGYRTLHLGKWHLGASEGMRPEDQGFDESLGFMVGAQMFLPEKDPNVVNAKQDFDPIDRFLWANLPYSVQFNGSQPFRPDGYMTDYLTDQAVSAIRANRNRPFFMYLAYNAPHTPLQALKSDYDAMPASMPHRERVYFAMIRALDRGVGRVMAELKAQGLDENTLVVFTSDNGGAHYVGIEGINSPYRGWKATFFEGGIRVPFVMRWPSRVPAGTRFDPPVSHFDVFATAVAASGATRPTDRVVDGVDLTPFLSGAVPGAPERALFWKSGNYQVVRQGDWKLQITDRPNRTWLYDLSSDPGERNDLSAARPEKVAELRALLERHAREAVVAPRWPALVEGPIPLDKTGETPLRRGDAYVYWAN